MGSGAKNHREKGGKQIILCSFMVSGHGKLAFLLGKGKKVGGYFDGKRYEKLQAAELRSKKVMIVWLTLEENVKSFGLNSLRYS